MRDSAAILLALVLTPCIATANQGDGPNLPAMGDSSSQMLTPDQEVAIGRQIVRDLRAAGLVLDDPQATEYLQSLGQRLASHGARSGSEFRFFVVDDTSINAFALPGGFIGINSGLIMASANESELAGVVAHEIAHVTQRHITRGLEKAARLDLATAAATIAGVLIGASTGNMEVSEAAIALGSAAATQGRINFTRTHEYEADRVGIGMLAAAGFDPLGMAGMFEELERRSRLSGTRIPEFLSTHPVSAARIAEARNRARSLDPVDSVDSRAYALMRARVQVLSKRANDAHTWFERTIAGGVEDDHHGALSYGLALAKTESGRAEEAIPILERLLDGNEDVVYFHLALADAEYRAGRTAAAIARYEHAMRLFPRDLAVTQAYAHALLHAGRGRDALPHLVALLPQPDPNPKLYRLLAMCSGAAGELADAHYFMSEVHAMNGQLIPAIDQLQLALAIPEITTQQRARAIARLEQLAEFLPRQQRSRLDKPIPAPQPRSRR